VSGRSGNRHIERSGNKPAAGSLLVVVTVVALAGAALATRPPHLVVGKSVDADFAALARQTWDQFLTTFWARRDCFGDVRLEATYQLDSRAGYDPATSTATIRVPGTAAMLQSGLIHEWAHHLEFHCPAHEALHAAFLAAQGLPADTPWRPAGRTTEVAADEWADIPSEQCAEAVVELVLGGRPIPTAARVSPAAVQVLDAWAAGRLIEIDVEARGE
jgi:hypothetical protein